MTSPTAQRVTEFSVFVRGIPAPQGSKTPGVRNDGTPFLRPANSVALSAWRTAIGGVLQEKWEGPPLEGAVRVSLNFLSLRPRSVSEKKRPYPSVKPDIDKLCRAALDAMTGIVFKDDAQVVFLEAVKSYAQETGLAIRVSLR